MTPQEEADLIRFASDLSAAERSPWEPRAVTRAFASAPDALVLTMQGWIDLDAAHSPLLEGVVPDGDDAPAQLGAAVDAFGIGTVEVTPEQALEMAEEMLAAVRAAFATHLKMRPPGPVDRQRGDGFGTWLPILACLISQLGMSRPDALATPVAQAFALVAAVRHNQGWAVAGAGYAQQEALENEDEGGEL